MKLKKQIVIPFTIIGLLILIPVYSIVINYFKSASTLSLKSSFTEVNLVSHHGKFVDFKDFSEKLEMRFQTNICKPVRFDHFFECNGSMAVPQHQKPAL